MKLRAHMRVDIASKRGRTSGVELCVTEMIAPDQVFMRFHFAETSVNEVRQSAVDPILRDLKYQQCAVRVEKTLASARAATGRKFFRQMSSSVQERA